MGGKGLMLNTGFVEEFADDIPIVLQLSLICELHSGPPSESR